MSNQAPRLGSLFKSKYLKADELNGPLDLTITEWSEETLGVSGERKHVLRFKEDKRALTINKTRENQLCELFGKSVTLNELPGKRIRLVQGQTQFQGKRVSCINITASSEEELPF